ncbi:MAG: hypothetical protein EA369_05060 [Bradymonadales bacterium]|nr:MAG: hypothetical protein EA369_05060 [Bradymonadales bacterium]
MQDRGQISELTSPPRAEIRGLFGEKFLQTRASWGIQAPTHPLSHPFIDNEKSLSGGSQNGMQESELPPLTPL